MINSGKNETLIIPKKMIKKHYYITPKKEKEKKSFHGFNFLITNIKNFGLKRDKISINKLLNSSKYMLRDNTKYKSCFDVSRNMHFYPYKPCFISNLDKKNLSSSSAEAKRTAILFKENSLEENKNKGKESPIINLLPKKKLTSPMSPISNINSHKNFMTPINKYSADNINLIDSFNKRYNNSNANNNNSNNSNNDYDALYLNDFLKNISLDKSYFENESPNNNEHLAKVTYFKFDSLSIKVKLSGLSLIFYELTKKRNKSILNVSDFNYNSKKISKIKFPFEFLYFFYGLNFDNFLLFLTKIIECDVNKNVFELNYDKFFENYNLIKSTTFFYDTSSFIEKYENNNTKEYFKYNWDINTSNNMSSSDRHKEKNIKNYLIKIQLPKMSISIKNNFNKNSIFYANIEIKQMLYFLKNNFLKWDQYLLSYFSEFKLFRFIKNNLLSADKNNCYKNVYNENCKDNSINSLKDLKKRKYNLNKTYIILNNIKTNNKSYEFFYSNCNKENYFFQLMLPKIIVNYKDNNSFVSKKFDLDLKTLIKLNKLRKSFNSKDIIKYCLIFIKGKGYNRISKNNSVKNITKKTSNKLLSKFSLKYNQTDSIKQINKKLDLFKENQNEDIIDIKLNLNENIFNFDEDILKFIKADKEKNNINPMAFINDKNEFEDSQDKKLSIEIEKIQLYWINNINNNNNCDEKKIYRFEDNESEYLFDHSSITWRKYIEKNFDNIILSSISESQIVSPSMKNSNSTIKLSKHLK